MISFTAAGTFAGKNSTTQPAKINITVSKETTYFLGPLNADGTVNYIAALNKINSRGVTPDNNAAVLLIKAFGPEMIRKGIRSDMLKALKIKHLPEKGNYFIKEYHYGQTAFPNDWDARNEANDQVEKSYKKARKGLIDPRYHPHLIAWLKMNEKPLELVKSASRRSHYFVPWVSKHDPPRMSDNLLAGLLFNSRHLAIALQVRAMVKASSGDTDGAISDLLAIRRLAKLISRRSLLIDKLVSIAIETTACRVEKILLDQGNISAAQAKSYLKKLRQIPESSSTVDSERVFTLDIWTMFARLGLNKGFNKLFQGLPFDQKIILPDIELDWNELLRTTNTNHDQFARIGRMAHAKRNKALKKLYQKIEDRLPVKKENCPGWDSLDFRPKIKYLIEKIGTKDIKKLSRTIVDISYLSPFRLDRPFELADRVEMQSALCRLGLVMVVYKADNGDYPPSLDKLAPKYVKTVPRDVFSGKALIYKRIGKGYIIYSIGYDMKDNGGMDILLGGDKGDIVIKVE